MGGSLSHAVGSNLAFSVEYASSSQALCLQSPSDKSQETMTSFSSTSSSQASINYSIFEYSLKFLSKVLSSRNLNPVLVFHFYKHLCRRHLIGKDLFWSQWGSQKSCHLLFHFRIVDGEIKSPLRSLILQLSDLKLFYSVKDDVVVNCNNKIKMDSVLP